MNEMLTVWMRKSIAVSLGQVDGTIDTHFFN